jgi:hypothetical protein
MKNGGVFLGGLFGLSLLNLLLAGLTAGCPEAVESKPARPKPTPTPIAITLPGALLFRLQTPLPLPCGRMKGLATPARPGGSADTDVFAEVF